MRGGDRTLMRSQHPALQQRCDLMDTRHDYMRWIATTGDTDNMMLVSFLCQPCIALPAIGAHLRSLLNCELHEGNQTDRKSTRLNSSHLGISYAVFCLKKKQ